MRARLTVFIAGIMIVLGVPLPAKSGHDIVSEDMAEGRRIVSVRLSERLREADLTGIAEAIKQTAKTPAERTLVAFYLPGMPLDQGAWASIAFDPNLKVKINGLRLEEQEQFEASVAADRRQIVGAWVTDLPAPPGRLIIYRETGRAIAEWVLRSGRKSVEELTEVSGTRGSRFDLRDGGQDYYLLKSTGALELRNKARLIAVAGRIVRPKPDEVSQVPQMEPSAATLAKTAAVGAPGSASVSGSTAGGASAAGANPAADVEGVAPELARKKPARRQAKSARSAGDTFSFRTVFQGTR